MADTPDTEAQVSIDTSDWDREAARVQDKLQEMAATVTEVDPDFLLYDLVDAAMRGDAEEFSDYAAEMAAWLGQDGAAPTIWPVNR